jgi:hypothetical protein
MSPPATLAAVEVPEIGADAAMSIFGVFGVRNFYKAFTGERSLTAAEWLAVAVGMGSGFGVGYYVGYHIMPVSCNDQKNFINQVADADWQDIAAKYWRLLLASQCGDLEKACYFFLGPATTLERLPSKAALEKFCSSEHVTSQDYIQLKAECRR